VYVCSLNSPWRDGLGKKLDDPKALENLEDAALVAETLKGRPEAFGVLSSRYKTAIMSFCFSRVHNRHTAEDLSQETFLRAFQALNKLKDPSSVSTWFMSIAHNICVDFHRRRKNLVSLEGAAKGGPEKSSHLRMDVPDDEQTPVQQRVINEETYGIILDIIDEMSEEYRVTLSLRYGRSMSCEQIAASLGVSVGTITSRLSRAHKIVRDEIEKRLKTQEQKQKAT
jgi:RNA polymerase sigma-70 factor, ECF subfamily